MIKVFKEEYQNCTIAVRTQFGRRVNIDTTTADAEVWSKIPEFEFLFEDAIITNTPTMKPVEAVVTNETVAEAINSIPSPKVIEDRTDVNGVRVNPSLGDLSLKELRQKFPDIKDTSRAGFLNQLGQ